MKKFLTVLCLALLLTLVCASALALDDKYLHNDTPINTITVINGKTVDGSEYIITKEPKCTTGLVKVLMDDGSYETLSIDPIHDWVLRSRSGQEANCETGGVGHMVCKDCGALKPGDPDVAIGRSGHKFTVKVVDQEETCSKPGKYHYECNVCGQPKMIAGTNDIAYTEIPTHSFEQGAIVVEKEPTCQEKGIAYYTCVKCGEPKWVAGKEGIEKELDPTYSKKIKHVFGEWIVTKPATCVDTGDGFQSRYCIFCNYEEQEKITAVGEHDWEYTLVENGTCKKNGAGKAAAATVANFSLAKRVCKICGKEEPNEVPANYMDHHNFVVKSTTPAGCVGSGIQGNIVYECTKCGGTKEVKTYPAKEHQYGEWQQVVAPTAKTNGVWERYCTNYKCTAKESYVGKTAPGGVPTTKPTATSTSTSAPTADPSDPPRYKFTNWSYNGSAVSGKVGGNVSYRTPGLSVNVILYTSNGTFLATSATVDEYGNFSVSAGGAVYAISVQLKDNTTVYANDGKYV